MRNFLITLAILLSSLYSRAQQKLAFPFQGGKDVMMQYFADNVVLSPELKKSRAAGTAVIKFTADPKGAITKIVVYYADDYFVAMPIIEALKKSDHKWVIPDGEKLHDFVISFTVGLNMPAGKNNAQLQKEMYTYYNQRKPILSVNQVPLDLATLLPAITVNYTPGS
jgi:hypothetical protein